MTLLHNGWGRAINLSEVYCLPSREDQEGLEEGSSLEQWVPFRKIFNKKHSSVEVFFQESRPFGISYFLLLRHLDS